MLFFVEFDNADMFIFRHMLIYHVGCFSEIMSRRGAFTDYNEEEAREYDHWILNNENQAREFIQQTTDPDAIRYLVEGEQIDRNFSGVNQSVREDILTHEDAPLDVKQTVAQRNKQLADILVPDDVLKNARTAIALGKPVVLYGPTGTGKTYFAKQLALETCIDYSIHTAAPTWTPGDITGSIQPEVEGGEISYHRRSGCVSDGIEKARKYTDNWGVIIDEITRADISQVFGPLYTAIEDDEQVIFRNEEGEELTLTDDVKIICTMNMSDRTVNELDNAITRRFAMIELSRYDDDDRMELFNRWVSGIGTSVAIDTDELVMLFEDHHQGINSGTTTSAEGGIMEMGPMHYKDVTQFLQEACKDSGEYSGDEANAVGQAFATYIAPRLLNTASLPQIRRIAAHYETLDDEFEEFDLQPAVDLAQRQAEAEQREMGIGDV
ncbi:AAA family ATPase [Halorubrum ezzemoulense]|nr:AAA family ATPase [Halorubrum ezzemoulense]MDB2249678.1 AAA family ATPase [Halorubrum ezzemoulense]